jgi:sulfoxide reductase catalytic subunit YedY
MLIRKPADIRSSDIPSETVYRNRRQFIQTVTATLGVSAIGSILPGCATAAQPEPQKGKYDTTEPKTPESSVTTYNNYYEFGTGKSDPSKNAGKFKMSPWTVSVEGAVKNPKVYALEDLLKGVTMEDRVYRMRCVERWSMVIPWHGFPLASLIKRLEPTSAAKYVAFHTLLDPKQYPEQAPSFFGSSLDWPYVEGLRMDEAMNELTFLALGVYGKSGPAQNGAPIRLVVPWKYGFKGAKAIAKIRFVEKEPPTSWNKANAREYGFYSNVNPNVDHPRWSQEVETFLDGSLLGRQQPTRIFNGYGEYVSSMYTGMDLAKYY